MQTLRALTAVLAATALGACDHHPSISERGPLADASPVRPAPFVPDGPAVDEPTGPPRLGHDRDEEPPDEPVCSERGEPGEALARASCAVEPPEGERPGLKTRVLWQDPEAGFGRNTNAIGIPPHANADLTGGDNSLLLYRVFSSNSMNAVDAATGEIVSTRVGMPSYRAGWVVDDSGETWLYRPSLPTEIFSLDGSTVPLPPFSVEGPYGRQEFGGFQQADLDFDGFTEMVLGNQVYTADFTLTATGETGNAEFHPGYVDVDGDGQLEVVHGSGIMKASGETVCDVDPDTVSDFVDGGVFLADLDGDDWPEVIVQPMWQRHRQEGGRKRLRIQDTNCQLLSEVAAWDAVPGAKYFGQILHIAPMLEPGRPAMAVEVVIEPAPHQQIRVVVILDHNLEFAGFSNLYGYKTFVFDHDGDGVYSLFGGIAYEFTELHEAYSAPKRLGLFHFDARTGEITTLREDSYLRSCTVLDPTGDGHANIYCRGRLLDGSEDYIYMALQADGTPWAPAYRFHHEPLLPYLYTLDGHFAEAPVSWKHSGMYRASPTGDPWTGHNADLVVRMLDVCYVECEDGWLTLWPQVGNQGDADVLRPVTVQIYGVLDGEDVLIGEQTIPYVQRERWMPAEPLRVPTGDYTRIRAVVSGQGWEPDECDLTNNEVTWDLVCPLA